MSRRARAVGDRGAARRTLAPGAQILLNGGAALATRPEVAGGAEGA